MKKKTKEEKLLLKWKRKEKTQKEIKYTKMYEKEEMW